MPRQRYTLRVKFTKTGALLLPLPGR